VARKDAPPLKMLRELALALGLGLWCLLGQAQDLTAEERLWVNGLAAILKDAQSVGIAARAATISDARRGQSPAFMAFLEPQRECLFVTAVRGNPMGGLLTGLGADEHERRVIVVAVWAHEYSHCLQRLAGDSPARAAVPGKPTRQHATREDEALADVFALAWMHSFSPADFDIARSFFVRLRTVVAPDTGRYAVAGFLGRAGELPGLMAASGASPYEMARHLILQAPLPVAR